MDTLVSKSFQGLSSASKVSGGPSATVKTHTSWDSHCTQFNTISTQGRVTRVKARLLGDKGCGSPVIRKASGLWP